MKYDRVAQARERCFTKMWVEVQPWSKKIKRGIVLCTKTRH